MPCDTVQYTELDVSQMQPRHLKAALEAMGFRVRVESTNHLSFNNGRDFGEYRDGKLRVEAGFEQRHGAQLRQQYSAALVKHQAKQAGWKLTETKKQEVRR